jgi:hypothetical protein
MQRNGEGKQLYRQERWEAAREKYRAALASDPEILGAQLNIACSYSRQGRFDEAAEEAIKLIRRSYVPWAREVQEAADLGILQSQPVFTKIQTARSEAAVEWGSRLHGGVFFVARTKPPVKVVGEGILVLRLNQEIFAWIPETGRFFQVTSEDGQVLAFAISSDKRRLAYLLGGKLVRINDHPALLRGLSLRVLDLASMSQTPAVPLAGDFKDVRLLFSSVPELNLTEANQTKTALKLVDGVLEKGVGRPRSETESEVLLTGRGVASTPRQMKRKNCHFEMLPYFDTAGIPHLQIRRSGSKPFLLNTRYGAGLNGMLFPDEQTLSHR